MQHRWGAIAIVAGLGAACGGQTVDTGQRATRDGPRELDGGGEAGAPPSASGGAVSIGTPQVTGGTSGFLQPSAPPPSEPVPVPCSTELGAAGCDVPVPASHPAGGPFDPDLVNLVLVLPDGTEQILLYVVGAGHCAQAEGLAWYYDQDEAPTRFLLCDAACAVAGEADLWVHFSCSRPPGPRLP